VQKVAAAVMAGKIFHVPFVFFEISARIDNTGLCYYFFAIFGVCFAH